MKLGECRDQNESMHGYLYRWEGLAEPNNRTTILELVHIREIETTAVVDACSG